MYIARTLFAEKDGTMGRPANKNKEQVATLALPIFWEHGFADASIADIVTATGQGRSSLYHAFGGKEELFIASLEQYRDTYLEPLYAPFVAGECTINELMSAIIAFVTDTSHPRGCMHFDAMGDPLVMAGQARGVVEEMQTLRDQWIGAGLRVQYRHLSLGQERQVRALVEAAMVYAFSMARLDSAVVSIGDIERTIGSLMSEIAERTSARGRRR